MPQLSHRWNHCLVIVCVAVLAALGLVLFRGSPPKAKEPEPLAYQPRQFIETSGWLAVYDQRQPSWANASSLEEIRDAHLLHVARYLGAVDQMIATGSQPVEKALMTRTALLHS